MSAAHTPGPWRFHLINVQRDIVGLNGQSIAYTRGAGWSGDRSDAEDMGNARLIAAAPAMLAALERVHALMAEHDRMPIAFHGVEEDIGLAIAAAKGQS